MNSPHKNTSASGPAYRASMSHVHSGSRSCCRRRIGCGGREFRARRGSMRALSSILTLRVDAVALIFVIVGAGFGPVLALVTPPFQVADEFLHLYIACTVSAGHLVPKHD